MEKVLLIEPQNILRQAIRLFLFPEYEVEIKEAMGSGEEKPLSDYDLLIIDGSVLRDGGLLPEAMRAIDVSGIPILWLQGDDSSEPLRREKLAIVKKPIEREAFQSAVAGLLSAKATVKRKAEASEGEEPKNKVAASGAEPTAQASPEFIDLVDVVEEERQAPGSKKTNFGKSS